MNTQPITHAMIFAAGLGTRMHPVTLTTPKAMVPILGKPMIDYRIDKLIEAGVTHIVVNTHYLAEQVESHISKRTDVTIHISYEEELLDTAGGLAKALHFFPKEQPFYVTNCDTIWLDGAIPALTRLANSWNPVQMDMLMLLHPIHSAMGYQGQGDFNLSKQGNLIRYHGQPHDYIYSGILLMKPELIASLPIKKKSLADIFFSQLDPETHRLHRIHGIVHDSDWMTIDRSDFIPIAEDFLQKHSLCTAKEVAN